MSFVCYIVSGIIVFGLCLGAIISVFVFVPITLYLLPYLGWLGVQQSKGYYTDRIITHDGYRVSIKNATRLYKHWITGQELQF